MADDVLPADETADCPFCLIVFGRAPAEIVQRWDDALAIVPLNPVTPGHMLVIPNEHVAHALIKPSVASLAMRRATEIAHHPCNLITSVGAAATQTVGHLHLHIVPRRDDDGLALPWSSEVESLRATVARLRTAAGDYLSAREARLGVIRDAAGPAAYYAAEGAEKAAGMALRAALDDTTAPEPGRTPLWTGKTEAPNPMSRWRGRSYIPQTFIDAEPGTEVQVYARSVDTTEADRGSR